MRRSRLVIAELRGSEVAAKQPQYRELIATRPDLSLVWKQMTADAKAKDGKYPYDPQLQNSNTLADSVLRDIKLPEPKRGPMATIFLPCGRTRVMISTCCGLTWLWMRP